MIKIIFLIILGVLLFLVNYFGFYRNLRVYKFREYLNDKGYSVCHKHLLSIPDEEYGPDERAVHEIYHAMWNWNSILDISYDKMLYSFKPLKEEYWLTKEQIKFLHKYD